MSGINVQFNSREIEAALGRIMAARVRRKAVNEAGATARRDLSALIADTYRTSKAGVGARGKAAGPGATNPIYVLRVNRRIRLGKLKAGARRFEKKRGATLGLLRLTQPQKSGQPGETPFVAAKGEGGRGVFNLPSSKGRKSRRVGGPSVSLRKNPAIRARRERIVEDLAKALAEGMEGAMKGKRTR